MANTGTKIVLTLKEINQGTGDPTGNTKPNDSSDPDYIPPSTDLTTCPISYTTDCPTLGYTVIIPDIIQYEFNLPNPVINNPAISKVKIILFESAIVVDTHIFVLPITTMNYFSGEFTSLPAGFYTINLEYLDSTDTTIATCPDLVSILL